MKQIRKGSLKFEGFKPFASFAFEQNIALLDPNACIEFSHQITKEIRAATNDEAFIFGHRTEAMFAAMLTSLDSAKLLKHEDGSDCFAQEETLEIPDFRAVLSNGEQTLIEVKNFHQDDPVAQAYRLKSSYMAGLIEYATLMKSDLKIAIYWSQWNLWSLNPPEVFAQDGDSLSVDLNTAMMRNEMSTLGDMQVGTKMPLKLVLGVEQLGEPTHRPGGMDFNARIKNVFMTCAGNRIEKQIEKNIALRLMFYGNLPENLIPVLENGHLVAIEHEFRPEKETGQGFELVGPLSSIFSRFYRHATTDGHKAQVAQIYAQSPQEGFGKLIPDGYRGEALPLWLLIVKPNDGVIKSRNPKISE
jgi:hypothetical protein